MVSRVVHHREFPYEKETLRVHLDPVEANMIIVISAYVAEFVSLFSTPLT
jgi:hypothetical protein